MRWNLVPASMRPTLTRQALRYGSVFLLVRPEWRPEAEAVQCIAHLDEDIGEVMPYLNAVLGGFQYLEDPPSVSFKVHGKLIAVHPRLRS